MVVALESLQSSVELLRRKEPWEVQDHDFEDKEGNSENKQNNRRESNLL